MINYNHIEGKEDTKSSDREAYTVKYLGVVNLTLII